MNDRPELRIGDREREAAATALGEHYATGRLTKEEYDERSERAWAARTSADLAPLFVDLPALHGPRQPSPARQATPAPRPRPQWRGVPAFLLVLVALLALALVFRVWPLFIVLGILWFKGPLLRGHGRGHWR
ncbi:MAG: DUF1707 SHOCT-like domain-containing protein [Nocardioidaceae bacterium]